MKIDSRIYVAGHNGMVGSALVRRLKNLGYTNILTLDRNKGDLRKESDVKDFFLSEKPEYVFMAAAKVGGIKANKDFKADFIVDNIQIQTNLITLSHKYGVKKLLFLGSSCIYPKLCDQPIKEEYLMTGPLEPTNDAYAIAKIAGVKMCQSFNQQYNTNFISVMPSNLYGLNDNYHPENSHVIPGLIRKFHEAKINNLNEVICWGDGFSKREFLFADDLADACIFIMNKKESDDLINIGSGFDIAIQTLAHIIKSVVYPDACIVFNGDISMNGTPKKVLNIDKMNKLGWKNRTPIVEGIKIAYKDFLEKYK
jgi:GDP-L-fucose synthase